jgi:hypothetical protein
MQGGRGGKHPVVCEVCPDRVGHNEVIVVGRRVTGYPRVIHDRHSCKRKWERNKEEIMKKWQRSDTPTPALEKFAV